MGVLRGATILVAASALALLAAAPAQAATVTSVVMFSDPGDYIGGGEQRLFHQGNGEVTVGGSASYASVRVSGGTHGDYYTLDFAAPPGEALVPGFYGRAQRAPFREAGRPGIDIGGSGRGCNEIEGSFEVKDIALNSEGVVERLWVVYEQHCEGAVSALFGEVRVLAPAASSVVAPSIVRWPPLDAGRAATPVPVTVVGPAHMSSASVSGPNAGDFSIRVDECSGRSLATGSSCQIWMRFAPSAAGTRQATLELTDAGGGAHQVALQGFVYGGTTRWHMTSDSGDYIGQGQTWSYTPANSIITARGSRQAVAMGVSADNGDYWSASFDAPDGDIIAAGTTYQATRSPFNNTGAGMSITGNGRGCNQLSGEFTVTEATFHDDGKLRSFGVNFEQHCEHAEPALRGTLEYRVGDESGQPDWVGQAPSAPLPGSDQTGQTSPTPPSTSPDGDVVLRGKVCLDRIFPAEHVMRGTRRRDRIVGTDAPELILTGRGRDRVVARGGDDCVSGGRGRDRLNGGPGSDILAGRKGRDRLVGGKGRDLLLCGKGRDVAHVTRGDITRGCERRVRRR